jgi:hypothetical protein
MYLDIICISKELLILKKKPERLVSCYGGSIISMQRPVRLADKPWLKVLFADLL